MILLDTNILSTFAKIDRVDLLFSIFNRTTLELSGNVEAELRQGVQSGYSNLQPALNLIDFPETNMTLKVIQAGISEQSLYSQIPFYPNSKNRHLKGEVDTVALAWAHGATIVCNERKVYNFCRNNSYKIIPCICLEDLLRSLWKLGIMTQIEVATLITEIQTK